MAPSSLAESRTPPAASTVPRRPTPPEPILGPAPSWDLLTIALFGAILSYIWRIQDLFPFLRAIQYPTVVSLAALGLYIAKGGGRRKITRVRSKVMKATTWILFFVLLSGPFSLSQGATFWFVVSDLSKTYLLMWIVVASIRHFEDVRRLLAAVVVGAFMYALYVEMNVTVGMGGRLGSLIMYDANDLGALLIFTMPVALFFLFRGRKWWVRWAAGGALLLFLRIIIKSGSRGAFLGLIGLGLYFLFGLKAVKGRTRALIVAGGVAVMLVAGNSQYWSLMETLLNPKDDYNWVSEEGQEGSGRMDVWKRGIGYMMNDPITGLGARTFRMAEGTISSIAWRQEVGIGVKWSAAHNSFVQIGAETGVGGLIAFVTALWLTFTMARQIGRRYRRARDPTLQDASWLGYAIGGTVVGFGVAGFFVSHAYLPHVYILFGVFAGLQKVLPSDPPPGRRRAGGRAFAGRHPGAPTAERPVAGA